GSHHIVFGHVDLNLGGGYNNHSGVFTAPVGGVYEFSVKISHVPPGKMHVHVLKQGSPIAEVGANGDDNYHDRSSANVVTHLKEGDRVWVERMPGSTATNLNTGNFQTTFMGILTTTGAIMEVLRLILVTAVFLVQCTTHSAAQETEGLETLVMQQAQAISQLQAQVSALQHEIVKDNKDAAFYVRFDGHHHRIQENKTIVFNHVELNEGGYYDNTTGIFTAPVSGLYLFNLKITHIPPGTVHAQ
ncbi:hypothetical protein BaRGS_00002168, partial [Batillaria attramentaria]